MLLVVLLALACAEATDLKQYFEALPVSQDGTVQVEDFAYTAISALTKAVRCNQNIESDEDMIWETALEFFHKKAATDTVSQSKVLEWAASGEFERFFLAWRRNMYMQMLHMAGMDTEADIALAAIMQDPPLFGFTYALYKAMTSGEDLSRWTLPRLDKLKLDL
jgi:hypothetical protein